MALGLCFSRLNLDRPPLFQTGKSWSYGDTGYLLLVLLIEKTTGHSYYQELAQRFLIPLRLALTAPSDRPELAGLAAGYVSPDNSFGLPVKTTACPGIMVWHPGLEWTGKG